MTGLVLPHFAIDADDDYVEKFRGYVYPRIHEFLTEYTPAYGVGTVGERQYAGKVGEPEEVIEREFVDLGLVRNPIACYKSHPDGRESEGSWVLIAERDEYDLLPSEEYQLHITLFPRRDDKRGREVYAHQEIDWRDAPMKHLRGVDFKPKHGAQDAKTLLHDHSYLTLKP